MKEQLQCMTNRELSWLQFISDQSGRIFYGSCRYADDADAGIGDH